MTSTTNLFARTFAATAALAISTLLVLTAVGPIVPITQAPLTQIA